MAKNFIQVTLKHHNNCKEMQNSPYFDFLKSDIENKHNTSSSSNKEPNQSLLIGHCKFCGKMIKSEEETLIVFGRCGHQFHGKCITFIFNCPECATQELPTEHALLEGGQKQPSAPLIPMDEDVDDDSFSNKANIFDTYQRPFAPISSSKPPRDLKKKLDPKIVQLLETCYKSPVRFDFDYFLENKITTHSLLSNKIHISAVDLYDVFDITEWKQLLQLQINPENLLHSSTFPVDVLATYYHVDYFVLKNDFAVYFFKNNTTLLEFLAKYRFTDQELFQLRLTFDILIAEGITREHLKKWKHIPFTRWEEKFGAKKKHFLNDMKLRVGDIEYIGWNSLQFQTHFQLNVLEKQIYLNQPNSNIWDKPAASKKKNSAKWIKK